MHGLGQGFRLIPALAVSLAILSLGVAAVAQARPFDLPSQPLADSLRDVGSQTDTNVLFAPPLVAGRIAPRLKGELSTDQAINHLLTGTGIKYEFLNDKTIVLASAHTDSLSALEKREGARASGKDEDSTKGDDKEDTLSKGFWDRFRLAQADQGKTTPVNSSSHPPSPATEQGARRADEASKLEEIVVTAQKREERLIDVPISIVAMSAEELSERKITSIDDLSLAVPGLFINSNGGGFTRQITLRGISNSVGNSSLIGLYLDEVSVTSNSSTQLDLRTYDLERVEVLRGPQGSLYGEGSVGGTIRFITKNPQLNQFAMTADVATLFTEGGAPSQRIEGMVNVPLIDNQLGVRIVGTFDHEGGWIDQPAADLKNYNDQDLSDVRIKGLWQPVEQLTVSAMAVIHRNDAAPNYGEDSNGNYTQVFNLTTTPSTKDNYDIYNITLTYDFPAVQVLSTSSDIKQDRAIREVGIQLPLLAPGTPPFFNVYEPLGTSDTHIFTDELRLTSIESGPLQWTVGGFYRRYLFDQDTPAEYFGLPGPSGTPLPTPFPPYQSSNLSKAWAAFGDAHYKLTDRFTLGTGLRYFQDKQDFSSGALELTGASLQTGTFHSIDPRFYAQYKLTDQVNTYASAAKGFRSGGFNLLGQPTYGPESVWTYELGTKMSAAGGRLSTDASVFYSDYKNYQIGGLAGNPPINITSNAGSAKIKGLELAWTWRPSEQWSLGFSGDYIDSYFYEINVAASSAAYAVGDPLDGSPKYSYTVSMQRDFKWNGRAGFARLDYNEQDRTTTRSRNIGPWWFYESDVIHMLNFNTGLQWNDSLSLSLFAQNLLNDRGFLTPAWFENLAARSRPRTVGLEFDVKF